MLVEVTQEDIDGGMRNRSRSCPVSLALQRAWKRSDIFVGFESYRASVVPNAAVSYFTVSQWPTYALPRSAERFIRAFDSGKPVAPFRFRVQARE